jgi:hypothetical protein
MINCVVLGAITFWQTIGLPSPEMDHFQLANAKHHDEAVLAQMNFLLTGPVSGRPPGTGSPTATRPFRPGPRHPAIGIGIPEQYAQKVFEPFHRLHGVGKYEGTGLGLATCRKIVERHGGTISCASKEGHGTTFRFTLRGVN